MSIQSEVDLDQYIKVCRQKDRRQKELGALDVVTGVTVLGSVHSEKTTIMIRDFRLFSVCFYWQCYRASGDPSPCAVSNFSRRGEALTATNARMRGVEVDDKP